MRKLLLATTALFGGVAFAASAQAMPAQTSPITLNVGGYVDFVAGFYNSSQPIATGANGSGALSTSHLANHDFESEFKINFDALGKAANGMQYGANVSLWNGADVTNQVNSATLGTVGSPYQGGASSVSVDSAYVWMSGAFGKVMMGDEHSASDLFVYAPTVGEGQVDGRYMDFVDPTLLARMQPSGIDNTEHSTKITYYTPKVGNDDNKVQLGLSYTPNMYDYGQDGVKFDTFNNGSNSYSPYQDLVEGDLAYTGNLHVVNLAVSGKLVTGSANHGSPMADNLLYENAPTPTNLNAGAQDFTSWGVGTQVGIAGFTVGGSYVDEGSYGAMHGQNKAQDITTLGAKYEFDKVGVAASWLTGQAYDNLLAGQALTGVQTTAALNTDNYVRSFNAEGLGATYTWFPGLTSNIDGVLFQQKLNTISGTATAPNQNDGYVLLLSQKMTF